GDELAEPEQPHVRERKADPVGAIAVLDSSNRLAFHHGRNSEQQREDEHEWDDGKKNRQHRLQAVRPKRPAERPVLEQDEDLVEVVDHEKTPNPKPQTPAKHRALIPASYVPLNGPFKIWYLKF